MKNLIFIIVCAFTLFLAIFYYQKYTNTQAELELTNRRVLDRDTMIFQLQKKVQGQLGVNTSKSVVKAAPSTLGKLSLAETDRLKAKGLKNPEADLKQDLVKNQQQVLTQKGTLGGTMAVRDIQVLNERYTLAYVEDGHNGGYLLLRYEVKSPGRITWTVLDNYMI